MGLSAETAKTITKAVKKKRPNGGFLVERQSKRGSESIPIPETDGKCEFFWFPNRPRCLGVSEASYII